MSLNSSKSVFHQKVQYFQERKYNFLSFTGRGDTFFLIFFLSLCLNIHTQMFITVFQDLSLVIDSRTRQVHCGSEHGKNEVFSFPLFRLRLTRINVGKYLTSCSIWDLRFASADASYIITKHNTICMKFLREFYFRELSGDSRKLNTAKIIFRQKKKSAKI